jgi:hypothetical protein
MRQYDRYLDLTAGSQHFQRHIVLVFAQAEIDAGFAEPKITQNDVLQESGQPRIAETNFPARNIEFDS